MGKIFYQFLSNDLPPEARDERHDAVRDFLLSYFIRPEEPQASYYIVDPFLDPLENIVLPMRNGEIDSSFACDLITCLALEHPAGAMFSIITSRNDTQLLAKNLSIVRASVPAIEFKHKEIENCLIRTCKYSAQENTVPNELHDRWLLQKTKKSFRGVHLGPSLQNFKKKDVTITYFDPASCQEAITRFMAIWDICERKRE